MTHVASPGFLMPNYASYRYDPLTMGASERPACLVIAPYNYPVQLALIPCCASLAAGNPTILKPSELCRETSKLLKTLVDQYFNDNHTRKSPSSLSSPNKGALQVVEGGIHQTTQLLQHEWGMIFFTGSPRVGKIVATAAAQTLTPTVLELGGKSPVYVDSRDSVPNIRSMVDRILWGKALNGGQTCVAPDYILCHESMMDTLCEELGLALERMFGEDPKTSPDLARMVTPASAQRLVAMIEQAEKEAEKGHADGNINSNRNRSDNTKQQLLPPARCQILSGGSKQCHVASKYVAPTMIRDPPLHLDVWKEELFGPLLLIHSVQSREEAIQFINRMVRTNNTHWIIRRR
jgi:acyl-CoA reductase-like NAD-dependent aldehyde dehydrogenase